MNSSGIRKVRSFLILLCDVIAILAIFSCVFYLRIGYLPNYQSLDLWLICATFIITLFLSGTYFRERSTALPRLPIRTFWICMIAGLVCVGWLYILGPNNFNQYFGRGVLPAATVLCGITTTIIRFIINGIYHRQEKKAELLYLGYSEHAQAFLNELQDHSEVHQVTIAFNGDIQQTGTSKASLVSDSLSQLHKHNYWHSIIIDPDYFADKTQAEQLVHQRLNGTPVVTVAEFYERYWFMVPIAGINDNWFLQSSGFRVLDNPIAQRIKRILDVFFSTLLMIASIPVMLLCAVLIKLSSRGPVFFRQQRVGLKGKQFSIIKLRTMKQNAELHGAQWAQTDDPRITRVGRFLRSSRLDEIPQCWNVLRGEMSFVGPRPEQPEFVQELTKNIPYYDLRHSVKPGLTGWAQVIFPYGASVEDAVKKLQYELYYIKNQSLMLDLNIVLRTLITVSQRAGR